MSREQQEALTQLAHTFEHIPFVIFRLPAHWIFVPRNCFLTTLAQSNSTDKRSHIYLDFEISKQQNVGFFWSVFCFHSIFCLHFDFLLAIQFGYEDSSEFLLLEYVLNLLLLRLLMDTINH